MKTTFTIFVFLLFLSCGREPSEEKEIFEFARRGKIKELKKLLATEADVNQQSDKRKLSALHFAAKEGDTAMVRFLVSRGAKVNLQDEKGETPLFHAAKAFFTPQETMKLLIRLGADVNVKNKNDHTLWCSLWQRNKNFLSSNEETVLKTLIESKASIPIVIDNEGRNLLHLASAFIESGKVVQDVIRNYKIDANSKDNNGWTALHFAALYNNKEAARGLLQNGVDVNALTTKYIGKSHVKGRNTVVWSYRYNEGSTAFDIYKTCKSRSSRNSPRLEDIFKEYGGKRLLTKRRINQTNLKLKYVCN